MSIEKILAKYADPGYDAGMKSNNERFKDAFESLGLTQTRVAQILCLGGGQPMVSNIIAGRQNVSDRLVAHIELLVEYREAAGRG